jgi:HSP20 family protein
MPFDDLLRRVTRPVRWEVEGLPADMRLDVHESDTAYTVKAEIPGVNKEDIDVRIEGDTVSISAERKAEMEVKEKGAPVRTERYMGQLFRSFTLGTAVDENAATAKYADGVLELTLPKRAGATAKGLAIQ